MKQQGNKTYMWTIRKIIPEAPFVYSLILEAQGERPSFISGQYLTVQLPGFEPAEGKSYSISSERDEPCIRLTIKEMGPFSKALCALTADDTLTTSAPYGFFYPEIEDKYDLVFVAGGIGITPCLSIIKSLFKISYQSKIFLFYSSRTLEDCIFKNELDALQSKFPQLSIMYHFTRETTSSREHTLSRINGESIRATTPTPSHTDFFVCGSINFTKSLWSELRDEGVQSSHIYTEGYF